VRGVAFSPDGARVVTASWDYTARVWNAATGEPIAILKTPEKLVNSAAFSPDGARVVTASSDNLARVWDAATGKPITILKGHRLAVKSAAFSPDGARVVTVSSDGTARVWDVSAIPNGDVFQVACAWLPDRDLRDVASDYGLKNLAPICAGDPPLPDPPAPANSP
jgi:WD40 repeat protein